MKHLVMKRLATVIALILAAVCSLSSLSVYATSTEENFLHIQENGSVSLDLSIVSDGKYAIKFEYKCDSRSNADPVIGLMIDGEYPFEEAERITLSLLQVALPKLQMRYLEFGVPATYNTFTTLLIYLIFK